MGYAFISYSSVYKDEAEAVRRIFTENGIAIWMAPYDIPVGSNYAAEINKAIKNSACIVLLLTDTAQHSQWVDKELERAINYQIPIIVLQLEQLTLTDSFEFYLSNQQWATDIKIDTRNYGFKKAMRSVIAMTGKSNTSKSNEATGKGVSSAAAADIKKKNTPDARTGKDNETEQHNNAIHDNYLKIMSGFTPPAVPTLMTSAVNYIKPTMELLKDYPKYYDTDISETERNRVIIINTLNELDVDCVRVDLTVSAAVIRYEAVIKDRAKAEEAAAQSGILERALGKGNIVVYFSSDIYALVVEVPNDRRSNVGLKSVMSTSAYKSTDGLTFALGKKVSGEAVCPDITKLPHMLIAGISGSGKTASLNALIVSLLYKYSPQDLRFIIIDPQRVEYARFYDNLPHLLTGEVVTENDKALRALEWAMQEMERRYSLFKDMSESGANARDGRSVSVHNIKGYNDNLADGVKKLPYIIIVIDEFGELMLYDKRQTESRLIKLMQKSRACGIHLILATQRTSADWITGLIKSNAPCRMCLKVGFADDSQVVLDKGGAEKLLGKGDMYFRLPYDPELVRVQGCFVTDEEVKNVTDFVKTYNRPEYDKSISDFINKGKKQATAQKSTADNTDNTFLLALKYCIECKRASVSMLQRRFPIGYMKSCKIIDWMENMNYITKGEGPNSRKVLLTMEEFVSIYGDIQD